MRIKKTSAQSIASHMNLPATTAGWFADSMSAVVRVVNPYCSPESKRAAPVMSSRIGERTGCPKSTWFRAVPHQHTLVARVVLGWIGRGRAERKQSREGKYCHISMKSHKMTLSLQDAIIRGRHQWIKRCGHDRGHSTRWRCTCRTRRLTSSAALCKIAGG